MKNFNVPNHAKISDKYLNSKYFYPIKPKIKSGREGDSFALRSVLIISAILAEIAVIVLAYLYFLQAFQWALYASMGISFVMCLRVLSSDKNSNSKAAWILFMLLLFYVGFIVYMLAGERTLSFGKTRRMRRINSELTTGAEYNLSAAVPDDIAQNCRYIASESGYLPYNGSAGKYFSSGTLFFEDVIVELKKAEKYIFIEFFIIEEGLLCDRVCEILKAKAAAGVDVRIIYDGIGSADRLRRSTKSELRTAGVKLAGFQKLIPILDFGLNYRDHRKIIVVDGRTAYTGGTNLADEYVNEKKVFGYWKDAGIRLDGSAVCAMTLMFVRMWEFVSKQKTDLAQLTAASEPIESDSVFVPFAGGPDLKSPVCKGVYCNMIASAKTRLYIMTPYLVPDDAFLDALKNKAKCGVDVRIIIPGIPDKRPVYELTLSNASKLVAAGVKVYKLSDGFLHSKNVISDDAAVVGSANIDLRSFYQQFESAVYTNDPVVVGGLGEDFEKTFAESELLTTATIKRNIFSRIAAAFLRIIAPLM